MKITSIAILLISAVFVANAARAQQKCPAPPVLSTATGSNIFSPQQELDLGDDEAEWLERNYRVIHDDDLAARLNLTAARILSQLPPTQLKFRIILIDSPVVNAFSVGAGRIYVTRKMVAFLRNDDELAGLLGHEMGHILTHQHGIEMTREFHDMLSVDSVGDRKDISEKFNRMLDSLARNKSALLKTLERERQQEEPHQYEADRVALYAVTAAGYSPRAFVDFFDRLAQTHGKTGNFLSDFFGATKPDEKRLREIHKSETLLPQPCREIAASAPTAEFLAWKADVISYSGLGREEHVTGVVSRKALDPPLRTDITKLKFSPNGDFALAQDDSSIFVFSTDPLTLLFRIGATEVRQVQFSLDSRKIVFLTNGLRVEEWNIDDQEQSRIHEMTLPEGCLQSALSHDGKLLGCVDRNLDFSLIDVESGNALLTKKKYFEPNTFGPVGDLMRYLVHILTEIGDSHWIKMAFSPDDHYFVATGMNLSIAADAVNHTQLPISVGLGEMLTEGFAFLAPNRVIVKNRPDPKNSAVVEFPSGKIIERLPIDHRQEMDAPTRGNYVILKPIKDALVGVLDLASQNFVIGSKKSSAIDVYDQEVLSEKTSGEVGIFELSTHKSKGQVDLPQSPFGPLRAWSVSPDLKWLAVSGSTRGAVWDLSVSKRLYYIRGFTGAYFDGDQTFYADFPKQDPQPRTIARGELSRENMVPGSPMEEKVAARQHGRFLLVRKPAGKENTLVRNITLEVQDVRDGHVLWSRAFSKEAPSITLHQQSDSLILQWSVEESAAKDEIKGSGPLQTRFAAMRDHKGAYLVEVLDASTGNLRGQLLIDTGKGSFRVTRAFADGDWVLIGDNENRTRVYSLSTGEQKAILFGTYSMLSSSAGILVVENESGQIDVYDLKSLEKRILLTFPYHIAAWSFSGDGKRLFILTANQIAYIFDSQALGRGETTSALAP